MIHTTDIHLSPLTAVSSPLWEVGSGKPMIITTVNLSIFRVWNYIFHIVIIRSNPRGNNGTGLNGIRISVQDYWFFAKVWHLPLSNSFYSVERRRIWCWSPPCAFHLHNRINEFPRELTNIVRQLTDQLVHSIKSTGTSWLMRCWRRFHSNSFGWKDEEESEILLEIEELAIDGVDCGLLKQPTQLSIASGKNEECVNG